MFCITKSFNHSSTVHRTIKKIKNYPRSLSDAKTNLAQAAEALKESSPDLFQADISIADIERVVSDIKRKLGSKSNSTILMPYEEALVEYYCATDEAAEEKHLLKVEALESEIGLTVRIEKESELFSTIHKKFRTKQLELAAEKILSKRAGHKKLEDRKKKDESKCDFKYAFRFI